MHLKTEEGIGEVHLGNRNEAVGMEAALHWVSYPTSLCLFKIEIIISWFGDDYRDLISSYIAEKYL